MLSDNWPVHTQKHTGSFVILWLFHPEISLFLGDMLINFIAISNPNTPNLCYMLTDQQHQAIIQTNVNLSSKLFSGFHLRAVSQKVLAD